MPLDRQTIEKKDFPISRRGYDVDAVDTHLRLLAEEVEELKRSSRRRPESLATVASEEVQAIVAAAETAATKIHGDAEQEADEIRRQARLESKNAREEATAQAAQYVTRVSDTTSSLLQRVESIDRELGSVVDLLRSAGGRVQGELDELQGSLDEVKDAVALRARSASVPSPATAPPAQTRTLVEHEPGEPAEEEQDEYEEEPEPLSPEEPEFGHDEPGYDEPEESEQVAPTSTATLAETSPADGEMATVVEGDETVAGGQSPDEDARLIALNMALNGAPRDEVDRYLAENFDLQNRGSLIDEVYAAIDE